MKHFLSIVLALSLIACSSQVDKNSNKEKINNQEQKFDKEFKIGFEHWEACETGEGECPILEFERDLLNQRIKLTMPCGGTSTLVYLIRLKDHQKIDSVSVDHDHCPPFFNLTDLEDGQYQAYMLACGLGGPVEFNLQTK